MHPLFRVQSAALCGAGFLIFWTIILLVFTSKQHVAEHTSEVLVMDLQGTILAKGHILSDDARADFRKHSNVRVVPHCPPAMGAPPPDALYLVASDTCPIPQALDALRSPRELLAVEAANAAFVKSLVRGR